MAATSAAAPRLDYDLYLRTEARRFVFRLADHGVRLFGDRIGWTVDGRNHQARLDDIVEIHLTAGGGFPTGGDAPLQLMRLIATRRSVYVSICRIRFADGDQLLVLDGDASGLADPQRAEPYSEFVVRLHERLAARHDARAVFAAGYSLFRYRMLLVLLALLGLLDVGAVAALFIDPSRRHVFLVVGASLWLWFQSRLVRENVPRRYDPAAVPDDILPSPVKRLLPRPSRSLAPAPPVFALPRLSRRWRWALLPAVLAAVGAIVWAAGVGESALMFEPGQAQRALAAIERASAEGLHLRRLDVTPTALTALVEASRSHGDKHGFLSHMETWTATHVTLFSGWREWDSVSGPHYADSMPVLEEAATKVFVLRPQALPDLSQLARAAIENAAIKNAGVRQMSLVNHFAINPIQGQDPLRWTVRVASSLESAEVTFDHTGRYAGADLAGTLHSRNLNLLGGGKDLDDTLAAIRATVGGGPVLAFLRITPMLIVLRTDDKQYEATVEGVADKTPQAFFCHMTTDLMTGRFSVDSVNPAMLAALQDRAREAAPTPGSRIAAVVLSVPNPSAAGGTPTLQWSVEADDGRLLRVVFDGTGGLLGVRAWDDRHYCE